MACLEDADAALFRLVHEDDILKGCTLLFCVPGEEAGLLLHQSTKTLPT